ncbi:MAG: RnfH family protein [Gammaproteobacteria bacterium]|nr:RnfH family protein [Gammaproteobacteria bacterium]
MADNLIEIEVAYARPDEQVILPLKVEPGTTVEAAIRRSGVLERFPEIDLPTGKFGVFGKVAKLDAEVTAGDRVEIYRPLIADPKESRKQRVAEGKAMKKGAAGLAGD